MKKHFPARMNGWTQCKFSVQNRHIYIVHPRLSIYSISNPWLHETPERTKKHTICMSLG